MIPSHHHYHFLPAEEEAILCRIYIHVEENFPAWMQDDPEEGAGQIGSEGGGNF